MADDCTFPEIRRKAFVSDPSSVIRHPSSVICDSEQPSRQRCRSGNAARPAAFIDRGHEMHPVALLCACLFVGDVRDYSRPLNAKKLDQATLDAESFGEKKKIKREDDGLRITLGPGEADTGWKTPQALRFGG